MEFNKNTLYEIHVEQSDEYYMVGYFVARDGENIVFSRVDANGFYDGLKLCKEADIVRIEHDTIYCRQLLKLIRHHKTEFKKVNFKGKNLLPEILEFAKKEKAIVGIELRHSDENDLFGFIETISDDWFTTQEIDTDGFADGKGTAKISDITLITVDGFDEQRFKILYDLNTVEQSK